jgi:hypothetical protein
MPRISTGMIGSGNFSEKALEYLEQDVIGEVDGDPWVIVWKQPR